MKSIALTLAVLLGTFSVVANAESQDAQAPQEIVAEEVSEEIEAPTTAETTEKN